VVLAAYFVSIAAGMHDKLHFLKYFTPFKYFDAGRLLRAGHLEGGYVALSLALVVVMLAVGYWRYGRRDLYI
jgi:ABC-2 type transport system permease protein